MAMSKLANVFESLETINVTNLIFGVGVVGG